MEDARRAIGSVLGVESVVSPEGTRVTAPMRNPDIVADLLVTFREAGIHLTELSVQKPTLDEVFLTLTGHGVDDEKSGSDEDAAEAERVSA
jgi:ABC-2 type transport system ATP-binding protein